MKIWVVGKYGLVARNLSHYLDETGLSYRSTSRQEVDATELSQVESFLEKYPCTHIINCAAMAQVDLAEKEQEKAMQLNGYLPQNLAKAAKKRGIKLIHFSTEYIFSGEKETPYKEEDAADPINHYGLSKLKGEELIQKENPSYLIIRTSRVFGPFAENPASRMINLLQTKEELSITENEASKPTSAKDLAKAAIELLDKNGIVHFANSEGVTRWDFVNFLYRFLKEHHLPCACKRLIPCKAFPTAAKRPPYSIMDCTKAEKWLRYTIPKWQDSLTEYLQETFINAVTL